MIINKNYRDHWAYDLSKNIISTGEINDVDVINQSIEMILGTYFGERLFNPSFGSEFPALLFENLSPKTANKLIDSLVTSIKKWEDRVVVIEQKVRMVADYSNNSLAITIPYMIKSNKIVSIFNKKVIF